MTLRPPNKFFYMLVVSKKPKRLHVNLLLLLTLGVYFFTPFMVMGQRVEPFSTHKFSNVTFYDYNVFAETLAAVGKDGTILVVSPRGGRTVRTDPKGVKGIYALGDVYLLLHRGDSLELLTPAGDSRILYTCPNLNVRKVYSKFVVIDCGQTLLLDVFGGRVFSIPFSARLFDTWNHVMLLDLDRFALMILTDGGWAYLNYSLMVDVAFAIEGKRGIYLILADGSTLLLDLVTLALKKLGTIKPSLPVAVVQSDGVEHVVLRDGTVIDERGRLSALQFSVSFMVSHEWLFILTEGKRLFFCEKLGRSWLGPLAEFTERVVAVIPARYFTEAPAVMVAIMRGNDLEILTIGFRDYSLSADLRQERIYALERAEVAIEVYRSGGISGAVLLYEGERILERVGFETSDTRALVQIQPRIPGCYDVYVEIAPRGYFPSKKVSVGKLCVQARPINCQLRALQGEVEEGGEVIFELRIWDALSGSDITATVLAGLSSLNVSHILPDGSVETMLHPPSDSLRLRLRDVGSHRLSLSIPPSGPYSGCVTDPATVSVKGALNLPLVGAVLGSVLLGALAGVYYVRTKTNVWRGIEKAVLAGASCDELTKRLSGVLPERVARTACEFVSDYGMISNSMNKLLAVLRPLSSMSRVRDTITRLENLAKEVSNCRSIYLKGDPENALKGLNELKGKLQTEFLTLANLLKSEKERLNEERKKLEEYLYKLEQYKEKASTRAYLKLKGEYENKLSHVKEELNSLETVLAILKDLIQIYSTF